MPVRMGPPWHAGAGSCRPARAGLFRGRDAWSTRRRRHARGRRRRIQRPWRVRVASVGSMEAAGPESGELAALAERAVDAAMAAGARYADARAIVTRSERIAVRDEAL